MLYSFLNDTFLPADETRLHASDLSIQRGYAVFDFFRVLNGHILFLDDHITRFLQSANLMRLPVAFSVKEIKEILQQLLLRNNTSTAAIKILLTGGYSPDGYSISKPNLVITQHPFVEVPQEKLLKGIKIITHEYSREMPKVKSINYGTGIWLQQQIDAASADDVLYHLNGEVSEFPRSNFFIVNHSNEVITPADSVLEGITRKNILAMQEAGLTITAGTISLKDVYTAKEAFLTSTTKRILPIVQIDDALIGDGKPGSVTLQLLKKLLEAEKT